MSRRAGAQAAGLMSIGRSRAKVYNTEKPKTTFDDVAGYGPVKAEIAEVVDFLKYPAKFKQIGARIPKGVLLVGPPGTGKTLIARAVAGEAGVPFVSVTGSDFMEMFVGVGAARVRDLFNTARKQAPAIIFVDEIDSIGRKRGAGLGGGHDEREQTLNQMLAEMDGFEATEGIVMMAATNRPDVLDPALLRPGRFDRQIVVPLPTQEERVDILKVHLRDKKISPDIDVNVLARGNAGHERSRPREPRQRGRAVRRPPRARELVHAEDFDAARDRVMMGLKRESMALSEEEKEVIAYHEGGHAVLAYVLDHSDPVHKVTILPTGMALGVTQQLPTEERHIYKKEYIADSIVVALGGRIAEEHRVRARVDGCAERPGAHHGDGPADGRASGACRSASARWPGAPRARCSSARTWSTLATTPTRRPGSSTKRSSASCVRKRPGPAGSCACTAGASTRWPRRCSSTRPSTGTRSPGSSTTPWAARRAGTARSARPTGPSWRSRRRPPRTGAAAPRRPQPNGPTAPRGPTQSSSPIVGSGVVPGDRSSATAAQRSVAVVAPTNARRTTPSPSATRIMGIALIS